MLHAFQWDLARQVERLDWLIAQLPRYADWGYQELYLHLEDAVDYPSLPGVARADAYSWGEFEQLIAAAGRCGIGVVPIVNLLGHTQYLIKVPEWRDLNELRAPDGSPCERGQVCPVHPRTAELAGRLLRDVHPFCTAGKVHVGLDESFQLGRHPLSRAEIERVGLAGHFAGYVQRLHALARSHQLRLGIWADLLALLPETIEQLPSDLVAYDWYYHAFRRHPRVELHNFAEVDLATPLRARGIEYWGCPMNGAFRFEPLPIFGERLANAQSWWRRCRQVGAAGFLVTSWEAYRLAIELTTVVDAAIASLWLDPAIDDQTTLLARGFARVFPEASPRQAARTALAGDTSPFCGYAHWEINQRWDVVSTRDSVRVAEQEARLHARLARRPGLPAPLAASLAFRHYLAERDAFVRRAARGVHALRRLAAAPADGRSARRAGPAESASLLQRLRTDAAAFARTWRAGSLAARAMWRRTRDPRAVGQNAQILEQDRQRLQAWRRWLSAAARKSSAVWTASPVAGAWQLQFAVINFAPAVQRVSVQARQPDGSWRELAGRHTIEFRTAAARSRANVRRSFVVPIGRVDQPLRIVATGIGEVAVTQIELTDGVTVHRARGHPFTHRHRLGRPAPREGWPEFTSPPSDEALELRF